MGQWKAVRLKPGAPLELYDLDKDEREEHDVAAAHADIVKKIEAYLQTARTPSERWPGGSRLRAADHPVRQFQHRSGRSLAGPLSLVFLEE